MATEINIQYDRFDCNDFEVMGYLISEVAWHLKRKNFEATDLAAIKDISKEIDNLLKIIGEKERDFKYEHEVWF